MLNNELTARFSALQRAEIAEIARQVTDATGRSQSFSALQRAEIAEIVHRPRRSDRSASVSVLFNEPKLLKCWTRHKLRNDAQGFSALQRAEIAEIFERRLRVVPRLEFQCSSTSRNC